MSVRVTSSLSCPLSTAVQPSQSPPPYVSGTSTVAGNISAADWIEANLIFDRWIDEDGLSDSCYVDNDDGTSLPDHILLADPQWSGTSQRRIGFEAKVIFDLWITWMRTNYPTVPTLMTALE